MDDAILVTGGAGFIGSHLVDALLTAGHHVRVLDDFSTGKAGNLRGAEALAAMHGGSFQLIAGDVRSEDKVREAVDGCAAVCHLAAVASVTRSVTDPVGTGSVTHGGTVNVVRWAVDADVPRVVLASSCAVYGDAAQLPVAETTPPHPLSPYAEHKLAAEQVCAAAADAGQLTAACLRFFNVFGPRQDPGSEYSGVISRFMAAAAADEGVTIYGDGGQTRDFVYVGDVVRAMVEALRRPASGVAVVNVGSGASTSVLDVVATLEDLTGSPIPRTVLPAREGDIRHSLAATGRARWVLGWEARTSLSAGMAATWDWYRKQA
jgi:UDP-glucose 4-epimerase